MWAAVSRSRPCSPAQAVHISMPHDHPERRYGYPVTRAADQVVNSPLNRGNSTFTEQTGRFSRPAQAYRYASMKRTPVRFHRSSA